MGAIAKTCSHAHSAIGSIGGKEISLSALADQSRATLHDSTQFLAPLLTLIALGLIPGLLQLSSSMDAAQSDATRQILPLLSSAPVQAFTAAICALAAMKFFRLMSENHHAREFNRWRELNSVEIESLFACAGIFHGCSACQILWNPQESSPKPFAWNSETMRAAAMGGAHLAGLEARDIASALEDAPSLAPHAATDSRQARRL